MNIVKSLGEAYEIFCVSNSPAPANPKKVAAVPVISGHWFRVLGYQNPYRERLVEFRRN
jgi:hypothetical protein